MEHKFCKDTAVECRFHKKGHPCSECVDITEATNFLLKKLKPKSGTLKTGIMNNEYAAYLMTEFSKQQHQIGVSASPILEADMVSFGAYLLSDERNNSVKSKKLVSHADLENWKHKIRNISNQ